MVKEEVEANAGRNRRQSKEERADSKPRAGRFDRRNRNRLRRWVRRDRRRRIDLRQHASRSRLRCDSCRSGSAANRSGGCPAAHNAENRPGIGLVGRCARRRRHGSSRAEKHRSGDQQANCTATTRDSHHSSPRRCGCLAPARLIPTLSPLRSFLLPK